MLRLVVLSPSGELCRTTVRKVSFPGEIGAFTVLPGHAPLVSGLLSGRISYTDSDGAEHGISIAGGFVRIWRNEIEACVEVMASNS